MDWLNPVEWLAWLYGKLFQGHGIKGGLVVVGMFSVIGLVLWIRGIDKYKEEHPEAAHPKPQAVAVSSTVVTASAVNQSTSVTTPPGKAIEKEKRRKQERVQKSIQQPVGPVPPIVVAGGGGVVVEDSLWTRGSPNGATGAVPIQDHPPFVVPMVEVTGKDNTICISNSLITNTTGSVSSLVKGHGDSNAVNHVSVNNVTVANGQGAVAALPKTQEARPEHTAMSWWLEWLGKYQAAAQQDQSNKTTTAVSGLLLPFHQELESEWALLPPDQLEKNEAAFQGFVAKLTEGATSGKFNEVADYYINHAPSFLKVACQ